MFDLDLALKEGCIINNEYYTVEHAYDCYYLIRNLSNETLFNHKVQIESNASNLPNSIGNIHSSKPYELFDVLYQLELFTKFHANLISPYEHQYIKLAQVSTQMNDVIDISVLQLDNKELFKLTSVNGVCDWISGVCEERKSA